MRFDYYRKLTAAQKRSYRRSDEVSAVPLADTGSLRPWVGALQEALERDSRREVESISQRLIDGCIARLGVPPIEVRVLAVRPSRTWGELHGLYEPGVEGDPARISVWMRTARQRRVVAFRTFLRTLLHELCHHLDYELLALPDTFHTEGFFKRESSLFHQLVGADEPAAGS